MNERGDENCRITLWTALQEHSEEINQYTAFNWAVQFGDWQTRINAIKSDVDKGQWNETS